MPGDCQAQMRETRDFHLKREVVKVRLWGVWKDKRKGRQRQRSCKQGADCGVCGRTKGREGREV